MALSPVPYQEVSVQGRPNQIFPLFFSFLEFLFSSTDAPRRFGQRHSVINVVAIVVAAIVVVLIIAVNVVVVVVVFFRSDGGEHCRTGYGPAKSNACGSVFSWLGTKAGGGKVLGLRWVVR